MKKLGSLFLLILIAGCGHHTGDGAVHVTIWSQWIGAEEGNFLKVLRRYEQLHPGIVIDNLGAVRDDTKTVRSIVAGSPPDVFNYYDPLYLGPLSANGALEPMDELFRESGLKESDFVKASLDQCRYNRRLYAMPFLVDDQALFWNKRAFRKAGLDPDKPPATLEDLKRYAIKLTTFDPAGEMTQLGFMTFHHRTFSAGDAALLFKLFGGRIYDESGNHVTPDDPHNIEALEWYTDLVKKMGGYRKVNAFAAGFGQAQGGSNPFFMGKIGMMVNGEWNPYWVTKYAPDLEYGVAPMPTPSGHPERAKTTWYGGNMFSIPKGSKQKKEAWDLLVWMQSDEAQILFADAMNNVPNTISALKSPTLRTGAPYRQKFATFLDLAEGTNGGVFPALPVANLYYNELLNALDIILDGSKTPTQAMKDVRIRVQQELDKYN